MYRARVGFILLCTDRVRKLELEMPILIFVSVGVGIVGKHPTSITSDTDRGDFQVAFGSEYSKLDRVGIVGDGLETKRSLP